MVDLKDKLEAEFENIQSVLERLPNHKEISELSPLELAGVAALIHGFYNGVENILKQMVQHKGYRLPNGESWHRDLVELCISHKIISARTGSLLRKYLAFRHFFSHSYAFELDPNRIFPLVQNIKIVYKKFIKEINKDYE